MRLIRAAIILILLGMYGTSASQELFAIEEFPEGLVMNVIEDRDICYYYITTSNNAIYDQSNRIHTGVLIDTFCDLTDLVMTEIRDFEVSKSEDYEPVILMKFGSIFVECVNYRNWDDAEVIGEFIMYDEELNYLGADSVGFNMHFNYPIARRGINKWFGLKTYPPPWKLMHFSLDTVEMVVDSALFDYFGFLTISSAIYDEQANQYLVYHNSGLGILDSAFNLVENIHATFVHTAVLGQLEFYQDKVISFGARLPPEVNLWQVTFNLYERDLSLIADATYGDTLTEDYPFIQDCLVQTEDAIFTGAMLDIEEPYQTFTKPIEFVVTKYDQNRNLVWRHNYGGDVAYFMLGLIGTEDGGCIVYGNRRNDDDGLRYPFIMKIDKDGMTTSTGRLPVREAHALTLYGNPVRTELRIHGEFAFSKQYTVALSSMQGQIVLKENLRNGMNFFDVSALPSGAYVYTITDETANRIVESHVVMISK